MNGHKNGLEIWGGLECTVNRVEDRFADQCDLNGHHTRPDDLRMFKELGITKLRYPALWEHIAPESLEKFNWERSDERLELLRKLGIDPIVTLLHHGSGPRYTNLLDPEFPEKLAAYAAQVAARYPWLEYYTPVNEPNTTARFSCMYGHWYPHKRDEASFLRALFNEIKGTILAMREIRKVNPLAQLVQTDDLGKAQSTPPIQYQVEFENHRRWLSYDMLFGLVTSDHPLYSSCLENGITEEELNWLVANKTPPDIIGINHYPLSNRFLDHRVELYPEQHRGGNGRDQYADVGAVDTGQTTPPTPLEILTEVWERYKSPFAVTEAHIAGGRESQMRWLNEIWTAAQTLRERGAEIRAVTAWSLLGAFDWINLCTQCTRHYESGVFDVRTNGAPRATALADMVRSYAESGSYDHPVLARVGYWHEPKRVLFAPPEIPLKRPAPLKTPRPLLITGATGTLGRAFARLCEERGIDYKLLSRKDMDIASSESVYGVIKELNPWAIINTAGYVRVDEAEKDQERCLRENSVGPQVLAETCANENIPILTFSSDLVFDGTQKKPYLESDAVRPLNTYGRSKAEAERAVLEANPASLVVRTSSFFGPWDEYNFAFLTMKALRNGEIVRAAHDVVISPTYVPDLVWSCLDLLIDGEKGLIHLTNKGSISWADWARRTAKVVAASDEIIQPCSIEEFALPALRPRFSALASEKMQIMPDFEEAWDRYIRNLKLESVI